MGWAVVDLGVVLIVDLSNREGIMQLVINPKKPQSRHEPESLSVANLLSR